MCHSLISHDALKVQPLMTTLGIDITHVNLPNPISKTMKKRLGLLHCWVDLPRMPNIEAERCLRQLVKDLFKLCSCPTTSFPFVHVLDADCSAQLSPQREVADHVGMHDERPTTIRHVLELRNALCLRLSLPLTWGVER